MRLPSEFIRLPLDFDATRLQHEVLAVPESDWRPHPQGNPGNSALPLVAAGGDPHNDSPMGPMRPTPLLEGLEYLQQVLASFGTVIGRSRLMRLDGNTEATLHVDTNYYWAERVRIHVPIVTSDAIEFICGSRSLHMAEGQSWIFDAWRQHNVLNPTGERRIHLVADTVGSAAFWDLVDRGHQPFGEDPDGGWQADTLPHRPDQRVHLDLERHNSPVVMSPWELRRLAEGTMLADLDTSDADPGHVARLRQVTERYLQDWRATWSVHADSTAGDDAYERLRRGYESEIADLEGALHLGNGVDAVSIARQLLILPVLNGRLRATYAPAATTTVAEPIPAPAPVEAAARRAPTLTSGPPAQPGQPEDPSHPSAARLDRPVFVVAPPRSGTSLLFETLAQSPSAWTIGGESHALMEGIAMIHPGNRGWDSNRLTVTDAQPPVITALHGRFLGALRDRTGQVLPADATAVRMVEKTPKNALRVPFLNRAFPDARFVYLRREPHESLSSMISAWESGRFVTYPELPGWPGLPWSLVLTPQWRSLVGQPLAAVVAHQWRTTSEILLADLAKVDQKRVTAVDYADLVADPQGEMERLCDFLDLEWDTVLSQDLPLSRYTLTPPAPDKWRQHEAELRSLLPGTETVAALGRALVDRCADPIPQAAAATTTAQPVREAGADIQSAFRSTNRSNFGPILKELGSSLVVSTYQSGQLVALRELDGKLNTHFRGMNSPMGLAYQNGRLAVGTKAEVREYHNVPAVIDRLEPDGRHDACFLPRRIDYTGDVRVHDVAWVDGELWVCATRFSCLATLDGSHSFVPRWQPSFITDIRAEDRCHLNGMAVHDGSVRWVTALGVSDTAGGWRERKSEGGVIIDVASDEIAVHGLSMPHSPRWYRDRLWVLESGQGTLAAVDLQSGTVETVVELPGFTRGLAFAGPLAFVGLSEVREATTFGGLPLTGRLEDRECGVWVVNIETGTVISFLRFEDRVEEIFDVCVLPGIGFPEILENDSPVAETAFVLPSLQTA